MIVSRVVAEEIARQDRVYGNFNHSPPSVFHGLNCIKEEHHEAMEAWRAEKKSRPEFEQVVSEVVQVAAVALRLLRDMTGEQLWP